MEFTESNKYYTPEIEEFYVGFEYEYLIKWGNSIEEAWRKSKIGNPNWYAKTVTDLISKEEIRVKYLDKEDIESLGFERSRGFKSYYQNWDDFLLKGTEIMLWWNKNNNLVAITKFDKIRFKDRTYFEGEIKNKSELKKVLKMIGVYE